MCFTMPLLFQLIVAVARSPGIIYMGETSAHFEDLGLALFMRGGVVIVIAVAMGPRR